MQKNYRVEITGMNDLLLHKDNIIWSERIKKWAKDPSNKKISVAGDDRTPAWSWLGCCYDANGIMTMDADCIMSMLREGGKKCAAPTGKGSMKSQTQSGIICAEIGWPLMINGKTINYKKMLDVLANELDFEVHEQFARDNGFELFVKRAKIGKNKHVRVRPRLSKWSCSGTLMVTDRQITAEMLKNILLFGGAYCGLGDWRPGSPSPGQFGTFIADVTEIK